MKKIIELKKKDVKNIKNFVKYLKWYKDVKVTHPVHYLEEVTPDTIRIIYNKIDENEMMRIVSIMEFDANEGFTKNGNLKAYVKKEIKKHNKECNFDIVEIYVYKS